MKSVLLFVVSLCAFGAGPADYFPLQSGNQWIYKSAGTAAPQLVSIGGVAEFGGRSYVAYTGFGGVMWLRSDASGNVYAYDTDQKAERTLIDTAGQVGPAGPCAQTGRVVSTNAQYSGPIGTFRDGVVEVRYDPGTCADAGVLSELYLPYVGLLQRTVTTIAGPRTYDLVYARVGVMVATAAETSFTLALDGSTHFQGSPVTARIAVRNSGLNPIRLNFTSGQEFDVTVHNQAGEVVYQWSADKAFTQALHSIDVLGELNWAAVLSVEKLPAGSYRAEAKLTTAGRTDWTASVPLTIVEVAAQ